MPGRWCRTTLKNVVRIGLYCHMYTVFSYIVDITGQAHGTFTLYLSRYAAAISSTT